MGNGLAATKMAAKPLLMVTKYRTKMTAKPLLMVTKYRPKMTAKPLLMVTKYRTKMTAKPLLMVTKYRTDFLWLQFRIKKFITNNFNNNIFYLLPLQ
jgi:hypothetical protein